MYMGWVPYLRLDPQLSCRRGKAGFRVCETACYRKALVWGRDNCAGVVSRVPRAPTASRGVSSVVNVMLFLGACGANIETGKGCDELDLVGRERIQTTPSTIITAVSITSIRAFPICYRLVVAGGDYRLVVAIAAS